jgi:hypothetical protein
MMGYTDSQGRPELVAQPFIKQGSASYRTIVAPAAGDQPADQPEEPSDPAGGHR